MSMKEFDRIIGYASIIKELEQIADSLRNSAVYEKLGVSALNGLLLYGEPGLGKTLMASSLINASGLTAYTCRKDKPNGDFVKAIKDVFHLAAANAPSIVFLDDMDKFANEDDAHPNAEEYVTVQSCIDEVAGTEVFVLATANDIDNLPDSLLRVGRFDRKIEVIPPYGKDAVAIIRHYLQGKPFVDTLDANFIAHLLYGKTCAELETVINEAGRYAGFERSDTITLTHFLEAYMQIIHEIPYERISDAEDWSGFLHRYDDYRAEVLYHEAGHAVISELLAPESVPLVSTFGKTAKASGFTLSNYDNENEHPFLLKQRKILTALGGMAAVDLIFGRFDMGNTTDLDVVYSELSVLIDRNCFSGFAYHNFRRYNSSESMMVSQESLVAAEVEKYYRKAKEMLASNREFLDKLAETLARKRILTMPDIAAIKSKCRIQPISLQLH